MTAEDERGGGRNHPRRNAETRSRAEQKSVNLCRRTAVFRQDIEPSPVLLRSIIKPSPDWFPDWSL